ncbi:hypothetical protein CPB85DRAFT_1430629 [Mucidula mucida]|nr:hypothetical protein CPB85DRAFT_1430629 [Mucidula mucida]
MAASRWISHVTRSPENYTQDIPDDVLVVLTLLQTRSVQATSSLLDTPQSDRLFRKALKIVKIYVIARGHWSGNHPNVERAAICALKVLVNSEAFGSSTVMTLADEAFASEYLFKGLNRRFGFFERDPSWLTGALFEKLWHVATASLETGATHNGWELVANIFAYVSLFPALSDYTETICAYLVHQDWLHDIGARLIRLANSTTPRNDKLPDFWCTGYIVIATTYIQVVSMHASPVFVDAKVYLEDPHHLAAICKILLLADAEKQQKLWDLAKLIRSDSWSECVEALSHLVACEGIKDAYGHVCAMVGWDIHGQRPLHYRPLAELSSLITTFARDQARDHFSPPAYADQDHGATESQSTPTKRDFYKRWRKLLQYEPPISNP